MPHESTRDLYHEYDQLERRVNDALKEFETRMDLFVESMTGLKFRQYTTLIQLEELKDIKQKMNYMEEMKHGRRKN